MGRLLQDVSYRTGAGLTDVPLPLVVRVSRPDQRTNGTCRVAVRTATTGVASCVGGAPPSFPRMRSDVASERVPAAASPRSAPPARRKRARKTGWGHPSSRHYAECKLVSSNCDDRSRVMCWRCPPSFPRMRTDDANKRVAAAASPRSVPTARRKRAR